ncbi:hypothetical protein [Aurantimonas sp. HBX-1]|uniref:hypothetical protein n=1 Tax=Aurantimonas sp. HBX-1 TaxID=2906072 RepID=UPI001F434583|nr:hypothetical protein [Aurantimonas sp. HBX-1]UIJ73027.1 hypothetical protein LXB15_05090 [Aurantimonas sp. HBX-1]
MRLLPTVLLAALSVSAGLPAVPALADVPVTGRFIAEARCPSLPEIGTVDNPGAVATEPGRAYRLLARTAAPATHYLIEIPGAEPPRRWVPIGCGRVEAEGEAASLRQEEFARFT